MTENEKRLLQEKHRLEQAQNRNRVKERKARSIRYHSFAVQPNAIIIDCPALIISMQNERCSFIGCM